MIKLQKIADAAHTLQKLAKQDMSFKAARSFAKLASELEGDFKFVVEKETELYKKYGKEKDGRLTIELNSPEFPEFIRLQKELHDTEVDITFTKLKPEYFEEIKISPADLTILQDFIEDDA